MNRVKLWVFTLLVVAVGYGLVRAAGTSHRSAAVASADARLASAAAHVTASTAAIGREAGAAAALVARDEALVSALQAKAAPPPAPPPPKGKRAARPPPAPAPDPAADEARVRDAARGALEKAEKAFGFALPQATVVTAGTREGLARKGEPAAAEAEVAGLLRGAVDGQERVGPVRHQGGLWYAAARPAGEGAGLVLLVPLDETWAKRVAAAAGTDVTVSVPDVKPVTTAKGVDPLTLQGATKLAGAGDVGRPGGVELSLGPIKLPGLPQPFAGGAPIRARAIPLEGVKGGFLVVSLPVAAAVNAPAALHWVALLALAVVLLIGLVLGLFMRATEPTPQVPQPLLEAAARIEKGDFAARAPQLAGKLGTLAAALNKAAEIAGPAVAARGAPLAPATTDEWYQKPLRPAEALASAVGAAAPSAAGAAAAFSAVRAAPAPAPAVAGAPAPAFEVDEETHWQQVFQDFLRTRSTCGEPSEGLTYDKFRQKLEGNKAQLVAKYACKAVRFQVYVKDGKAALKATPVK